MAKRQRTDSGASSSADEESDIHGGTSKYVQFDESLNRKPVIRCALAPHSRSIPFYTLEEYDVHYAQIHSNRCRECHKNLPSSHFLALHISENHDPINEARRARGEKTYACFVEGCEKVCSDPRKRRMHLVDKHLFPKNYDFFVVNDGVDPRRSGSMLRPAYRHRVQTVTSDGSSTLASTTTKATGRSLQEQQGFKDDGAEREVGDGGNDDDGSSVGHDDGGADHDSDDPEDESLNGESADEDEHHHTESCRPSRSTNSGLVQSPRLDARPEPEETELANLTSSMSALKFVPPSIRFGRGTRGGFAKR